MRVEAPGGVADHHVGAAGLGRGDRVEGDRARVAPLGAADDLGAGAIRPLGELVDGRGSVGVRGGDDHVEAELLLQVPGDLADRRRLAGAVHPDDHQDRGPIAQVDAAALLTLRRGGLRQHLDQPLAQLPPRR